MVVLIDPSIVTAALKTNPLKTIVFLIVVTSCSLINVKRENLNDIKNTKF